MQVKWKQVALSIIVTYYGDAIGIHTFQTRLSAVQ